MRVLMFGWEFPPHIAGGLGTACYGLTKALTTFDDVKITFVVPKAFGDEDKSVASFVNAEAIGVDQNLLMDEYLSQKQRQMRYRNSILGTGSDKLGDELLERLKYLEIESQIKPYLSPEEFEKLNAPGAERNFVVKDDGSVVLIIDGREIVVHSPSGNKIETGSKVFYRFSGSYGSNLLTEVTNYARVAAEIAKFEEFDIIHAHDWLTYQAGVAAKKMTGKKLVIHVHATEFDRSGENVNQIVYDIERFGMVNADKIITVSNLTREIVIGRYGIPEHKVTVVHNGVISTADEHNEYEKKVKKKIVTFLGRITYQKGPEYFIEAACKVLKKTDDVIFVMAGSGDMLFRMIKRAAELKIADKFHFTNFLKGKDVDHMFSISDVYVMPSVSEPFGISPLEAMRSSVPVIISKQSGVAEILKHAIKVDFWDIDAIADSIYGLVKYEGLSKMFRKLGRQEVENIQWDKAASLIRDVYLQELS
ncbi:MAG: glycosyltransferase family 4 protein [Bacteroidales bacterium]